MRKVAGVQIIDILIPWKKLQPGDIERSILGLGHAYSRSKVKFSVQKQDNHIIQAIATLDQIDKDLNTFCMRLRENYGEYALCARRMATMY